MRAATCRWSAVTGVESAVHTRMAGTDVEVSKALRACRAFVDSALRGRNAAWSFVATSPSLPAYGPSVPPMPSQTSTRTNGTIQRAQRGVLLTVVPT